MQQLRVSLVLVPTQPPSHPEKRYFADAPPRHLRSRCRPVYLGSARQSLPKRHRTQRVFKSRALKMNFRFTYRIKQRESASATVEPDSFGMVIGMDRLIELLSLY